KATNFILHPNTLSGIITNIYVFPNKSPYNYSSTIPLSTPIKFHFHLSPVTAPLQTVYSSYFPTVTDEKTSVTSICHLSQCIVRIGPTTFLSLQYGCNPGAYLLVRQPVKSYFTGLVPRLCRQYFSIITTMITAYHRHDKYLSQ